MVQPNFQKIPWSEGDDVEQAEIVAKFLNRLTEADIHLSTIKITHAKIGAFIHFTIFYRHTEEIQCKD